MAALFCLALALRLPRLGDVPRFTDEGLEVLWGLAIAQGRHLPLTAVDAYDGPLFAYLMAALFRLFGVHLLLPRLTIALAGALTVPATYALGWLLGGRVAALAGACLALTSPTLVVFSSHQGWTSSLAPFFTTLTAAALIAGVQRQQSLLIALGGLLAALSLQAHPTTAAALTGLALWLLASPECRRWRRKGATLCAGAALFLLGYAPMLIANARPDSPMLRESRQRAYAFAPTLDPVEYLRRLARLLEEIAYAVSGANLVSALPLRVALSGVSALLVSGALLVLLLKGAHAVPAMFASTLLLLPIVVKGESLRYFAGLLPLAYAASGVLAARLMRRKPPSPRALAGRHFAEPRINIALSTAAVSALCLCGLAILAAFYRRADAQGMTNAAYFQLRDATRERHSCGPDLMIVIDPTADDNPRAVQTGFALQTVDYVLTMSGCPHTVISREAVAAHDNNAPTGADAWLILSEADAGALSGRLALTPVLLTRPAPVAQTTVPVGLYRYPPAP